MCVYNHGMYLNLTETQLRKKPPVTRHRSPAEIHVSMPPENVLELVRSAVNASSVTHEGSPFDQKPAGPFTASYEENTFRIKVKSRKNSLTNTYEPTLWGMAVSEPEGCVLFTRIELNSHARRTDIVTIPILILLTLMATWAVLRANFMIDLLFEILISAVIVGVYLMFYIIFTNKMVAAGQKDEAALMDFIRQVLQPVTRTEP